MRQMNPCRALVFDVAGSFGAQLRVWLAQQEPIADVALANSWIVINAGGARPTTSRRSPWRRHAIRTGSAASSISGSKTSTPCTPNGAPGVLSSWRRRNSTSTRSGATSAIPTVIWSRWADHGPAGWLVARSLAVGYAHRGVWV